MYSGRFDVLEREWFNQCSSDLWWRFHRLPSVSLYCHITLRENAAFVSQGRLHRLYASISLNYGALSCRGVLGVCSKVRVNGSISAAVIYGGVFTVYRLYPCTAI